VAQGFEITPRKRPTQARAIATFDALVDACARLLPELGYEHLTTNAVAERAGVGIGSLYEYFPGKDAIIAVVVERLVERVMTRLGEDLDAIVRERDAGVIAPNAAIDHWMARVYEIVAAEGALVAVLLDQVPYTRQLDILRDLPQRLLDFSERARAAAGVELAYPSSALTLINNLVSTTILQVVLDPPSDQAKKAELIAMLTAHVKGLLGGRP
jgi:AcrR family transcriptional regulator